MMITRDVLGVLVIAVSFSPFCADPRPRTRSSFAPGGGRRLREISGTGRDIGTSLHLKLRCRPPRVAWFVCVPAWPAQTTLGQARSLLAHDRIDQDVWDEAETLLLG